MWRECGVIFDILHKYGTRRDFLAVLSLCLGGTIVSSEAAERREEALVDQVREAIKKGKQFLFDQQKNNGDWEVDTFSAGRPGGWTSLALLALLNAGAKPNDPAIQRGLNWLRKIEPADTYVVGLQTMVFVAVGSPKDKERIQRNVDWLVDARIMDGNTLQGWSYKKGGGGGDNSNTQYALLGLHDGHQAGANVNAQVWESIRDYYIRTQLRNPPDYDGAWYYNESQSRPRLTMTTAGLCGLLIAGMELNQGRETILPDGSARHCGQYTEKAPIKRALDWIGDHFRLEFPSGTTYYNLYGIERAGRLSGQRFIGQHDWYREGCKYLVKHQNKEDGSWSGPGPGPDSWPVISTSFALLFLSKGRTPVLISKLVHGPRDDWNNDRNDVRHLVEFASRELFKKQPLAWQVFEAKRALGENRDALKDVVSDLLQSPIAFFNGHLSPYFEGQEETLLKEYVDQGGFLLAEACCGKERFDAGFKEMMGRIFPGNELKRLPPDHPIWSAHFLVSPKEFTLYGVQIGCKTVVVYSPQDLSCRWEANQTTAGKGRSAFRLGANIIAYATGLELPKPRLTHIDVITDKGDEKKIKRGYLQVVQLRHEGDWQPAPRAMRNLMAYLADKPRLDVTLQTEALYPSNPVVLNYKFLYMHGRNSFNFDKDTRALANLRANLQTGGLLLADACCGKKAFDKSFRLFIKKVFPDKTLERIPLTDELFSKELNGTAITTVRCRRERPDGSGPQAEFHNVQPFLEGIKYNNRWVVIYSKYDLGCALEHHASPNCLGHDYASAIRLGSAAVLYALKR